MLTRPTIFDVPLDPVTLSSALDRAEAALAGQRLFHVVTPGPEFLMAAHANRKFRAVLQRADLSLPDGFGVIMAAWWLGLERLSRVTGMDFVRGLAARAAVKGYRLFLFGGASGVVARAAAALVREFPGIRIAGVESGVRGWVRLPDALVSWRIRRAQPDILLVALGAPKQELWIDRHRAQLGRVRLVVGVGGVFDYLAGAVRWPPRLVRLLGLEWLWRLVLQPRQRWQRIVTATWRFAREVLREKRRPHAVG
ncbi:MAG: WecB/TagA/CpsF family glycosyltransferase [Candidatus Kerfeldbacteria bacterium]|nr:WecB/TagA/CpsF family glycosyltransferase [Candidatus Kerfeldbacteria bacterium]